MKKPLLLLCVLIIHYSQSGAQSCTPAGDEVSYGSNDVWLGYIYHNINFTSYAGYVTQGSPGNPTFDQNFGGDNVNYNTNGCPVQTETFSARYKLRKTFAAGGYQFTVGGDDGYRLSLDGGSTWIINRWQDQSYTIASHALYLDGEYELVLEYYENGGHNRISFSYTTACIGSEDPTVYGTNDTWRGYVYDGTNFNTYMGLVTEGSPGVMSFDQNFGGSNVLYNTSSCPVQTETFSVRYRLRKNFPAGNYVFTVGGDDGYRLSLDGGSTWVINRWWDQSYNTETYSTSLSGIHDLVLEFYENGGDNRVSIDVQSNIILSINLLNFSAKPSIRAVDLNWEISKDSDASEFIVERSEDGRLFESISQVPGNTGSLLADKIRYHARDEHPLTGRSFYRLRMTDMSQKVTYSATLSYLSAADQTKNWEIFPTLLEGNTVFIRSHQLQAGTEWHLYNLNGQLLNSGRLGTMQAGQVSGILPFPNRSSTGLYLLVLRNGGKPVFSTRISLR